MVKPSASTLIGDKGRFTYVLLSPARHHQSSGQSAADCSYSLSTVIAALQTTISNRSQAWEIRNIRRTLLLPCCDLLLRHCVLDVLERLEALRRDDIPPLHKAAEPAEPNTISTTLLDSSTYSKSTSSRLPPLYQPIPPATWGTLPVPTELDVLTMHPHLHTKETKGKPHRQIHTATHHPHPSQTNP